MGETRHIYINKEFSSSIKKLDELTPEGMTFSGMIGKTVDSFLGNVDSAVLPQFNADDFIWRQYLKALSDDDFDKFKRIYIGLGKLFEREMLQRDD